jgi:hypothetical protein
LLQPLFKISAAALVAHFALLGPLACGFGQDAPNFVAQFCVSRLAAETRL